MAKIEVEGEWNGEVTWFIPTVAPLRQKVLGCIATLSASVATGLSIAGVHPIMSWRDTGANMHTSFAFFYTAICFISVRDLQHLLGVKMTPRWIVRTALHLDLMIVSLIPYYVSASRDPGMERISDA